MNVLADLAMVKHFIFDVDGVLTTGEVLLLDSGEMARTMHTKDGYAMQLAIKKGYTITIITGAEAKALELRFTKLGINNIHLGISEKLPIVQEIMGNNALPKSTFLFMGDDMPDYDAMKIVGVPCCPADAVPEIKKISAYISPYKGGEGCVRDVIEKVLKMNGHWATDTELRSI